MKKKISKLAAALMIAGFMMAGAPQAKADDDIGMHCIVACGHVRCDPMFANVELAIIWIDIIEDALCPL